MFKSHVGEAAGDFEVYAGTRETLRWNTKLSDGTVSHGWIWEKSGGTGAGAAC